MALAAVWKIGSNRGRGVREVGGQKPGDAVLIPPKLSDGNSITPLNPNSLPEDEEPGIRKLFSNTLAENVFKTIAHK